MSGRAVLLALALIVSIAVPLGCGDGNDGGEAGVSSPAFPTTTPHQGGVTLPGGLVTRAIGQGCGDCHEDVVAAYATSGMHESITLPAGAGSVESRLVGTTVVDPGTGITGRFELADGRYLQRLFYLDPEGVERRPFTISADLVVGSGHAARSYFALLEGHLFELPFTWYRELDDLALSPGGGFTQRAVREATHLCVVCHTGWVEPEDAREMVGFRGEITLGIGCERCHGDGAQHIETGDPLDIVNPARLDGARQSEVCYQCHLSGVAKIIKSGRRLAEYTPGERLGRVYSVFKPAESEFDGGTSIAGHGERMRRSRCFTASEKIELTCTTCHNPHRGHLEHRGTGSSDRDDARGGCLVCHDSQDCGASHGTRGDAACADCHMSRVASSDIQHTSITDHWIQVRPAPAPAGHLSPEQRSIGAYALRDTPLENVLDPDDSLPGARLAKARAYVEGSHAAHDLFSQRAPGYLRRAGELVDALLTESPGDTGALLLKADTLNGAGYTSAAIKLLDRVLAEDPERPSVLAQRAFAQVALGLSPRAIEWLRRARDAAPSNENVAMEFARVLHATGDSAGALDALELLRTRTGPTRRGAQAGVGIAYESGLFARGLDQAYDALIFAPRDPAAVIVAADFARLSKLPPTGARALYRHALELQPNAVGALVGISELELAAGQRDSAVEYARRAAAIAPNAPVVIDLIRRLR